MRLIDANVLEQAGYILTRIYQQDAKTMVYETKKLSDVPSAQPDDRLAKIAELVEGTIDNFDRDDAMDLLYQIKEVLKNET
jgi:hypothetical protein